jgi:alkylated DNA repair dioxygenase AlkB
MLIPVRYTSCFLPNPDKAFSVLWNELGWERRADAPRREYWTNVFGRDYTYGRGVGVRTYKSRPTHKVVDQVAAALERDFSIVFEGCFLNGYENERDALGWHADDDPAIDHSKPIAVVTLGGPRAIQFRPKEVDQRSEIMLEPGSLLMMLPGMQATHLHRIPKASFKAKPRISLTFRGLLP